MRHLFLLLLTTLTLTTCLQWPSYAIAPMNAESLNLALRYGMENQHLGLSAFMGSNWQEGPNGSLLNIYTPFMEIARKISRRGMPPDPTDKDVTEAKRKIRNDIDYIWTHPTVKFMVSMNGDSSTFAGEYFAVIEGYGKGRKYRILPLKSIPQFNATHDPNAKVTPYSAINAYHFNFQDIERLELFTLRLYKKDGQSFEFKVANRRIL